MCYCQGMRLIGLLPLLPLAGCAGQSSIVREAPSATFKSHRSVTALEKCITENLSKLDDVTSVTTGGVTTLLFGERTKPSMLLDLTPHRVTVTTNFAPGTRDLIVACL